MVRSFAVVACSVVVLLGTSCGGSGPKLYPVRGSVIVNGQPAEGATVILEPATDDGSTNRPTGVVTTDGSFTLQSPPHGEGVAAGEYLVLISWFPPDARQSANPRNKLPAKYSDRAATPLPKVTVTAGDNALPPFQLTVK